MSGEEIFNMVEDIDIKLGKKKAKKWKHDGGDGDENITEKLYKKKVNLFLLRLLEAFISSPSIKCDAH